MGMRTIVGMTLAAAVALSLAACGGGGDRDEPAATCAPSGTSLSITAMSNQFDTDCLAASAGKPFTIALDNQDPGTPHDLSIYSDPGMTQALFKGSIIDGVKTETYHVHPLQAGTYHFHCDVHPSMEGSFVVA
jgi:plastocyanin